MTAVVNRLQQPHYNESEGRRTARHIDQLSRRLFPATFLAFNVIYWTVYAAVENPVWLFRDLQTIFDDAERCLLTSIIRRSTDLF